MSEDDFANHFTADIDPVRARVMYAVQQLGHMQLVQGFAPQVLNRGSGKILWVSSAVGTRTRWHQ